MVYNECHNADIPKHNASNARPSVKIKGRRIIMNYFNNSNTFGPFVDGRSYSEGVAFNASECTSVEVLNLRKSGVVAKLVGVWYEASCLNGEVRLGARHESSLAEAIDGHIAAIRKAKAENWWFTPKLPPVLNWVKDLYDC